MKAKVGSPKSDSELNKASCSGQPATLLPQSPVSVSLSTKALAASARALRLRYSLSSVSLSFFLSCCLPLSLSRSLSRSALEQSIKNVTLHGNALPLLLLLVGGTGRQPNRAQVAFQSACALAGHPSPSHTERSAAHELSLSRARRIGSRGLKTGFACVRVCARDAMCSSLPECVCASVCVRVCVA